uniref:Uncharacterized protein n=1 Tax=viral metagenome TaxID=1070528 RepID=A0A6H1Z7N8_9ZZZZ
MIAPGVAAIIAVAGGLAAVGTAFAIEAANRVGPQLRAADLLPAPPPRLPLPRFLYEKPELLDELKKR